MSYLDPKKAPLAVRKKARQLLRERWDKEAAAQLSQPNQPETEPGARTVSEESKQGGTA